MKCSWVLVLCLVVVFSGHAQNKPDSTAWLNDQAFVTFAKAQAIPLQHSDRAVGDADLLPVRQMIGKARVLALGEPAHGFHEPLAFRNRLFRYLVEHSGFTTIVLEAGMAQSRAAADFVAGGPGTANDAAAKLSIAGAAPETVALLVWMRTYNADPAHPVKLHFYGMDIELVGFPGDTTASHAAIDEVLNYLDQVDPGKAATLKKTMAPYLAKISVKRYPLLTPDEHQRLSALIEELITTLVRDRNNYLQLSSKEKYEWALQNAHVAQQTDYMVRMTPPDQPGKIPPEAWKAANVRDSSMTENVQWILEHAAEGGKLLVYAHNAHVKNEVTVGSVWDAFARPPNGMGLYLRLKLTMDLFIIGSSIEPMAATSEPASLDNALVKVGMQRFILDLRTAKGNAEVLNWLQLQRPMQANKYAFFRVHPSEAFDALLFMGKGNE